MQNLPLMGTVDSLTGLLIEEETATMHFSIRKECVCAAAAAAIATVSMSAPVLAGSHCAAKAAEGTASDEKSAQFQVYEALLQATDWGAWAAWMSSGKTPGYKVNPVKYKCSKGGLGVTCRGQTTICKL